MAYKEQQPKPLGEVGSKTTFKSGGKKELVKEHKRLVHVLRSPSRKDDKEEAELQEEELEEMEEGKDYKPAIKKSLERANDLIKAMKKGCEDKEDSLSEEEMDLEKKKSEPNKVVKALKAAAILGLTRRQRMDTAYRLGLAQGVKAQKTPFATEDLSETPIQIGISEQQTRPSYEPPVVPVRQVNNTPGYIAPKPCGDHEYKTAETGPAEAKPIKDR